MAVLPGKVFWVFLCGSQQPPLRKKQNLACAAGVGIQSQHTRWESRVAEDPEPGSLRFWCGWKSGEFSCPQRLEQVSQGSGTKPHRAEGIFGEFSHLVGFLGCPELDSVILVSPNWGCSVIPCHGWSRIWHFQAPIHETGSLSHQSRTPLIWQKKPSRTLTSFSRLPNYWHFTFSTLNLGRHAWLYQPALLICHVKLQPFILWH